MPGLLRRTFDLVEYEASLEKVISFLKQQQKDKEIVFVYGSGKPKSSIKKFGSI